MDGPRRPVRLCRGVLSCCPRPPFRSTSTRIRTDDPARTQRWLRTTQQVQVRILYQVGREQPSHHSHHYCRLLCEVHAAAGVWHGVIVLLAPALSSVVWGGEVQCRVSRRCSGRFWRCGRRSPFRGSRRKRLCLCGSWPALWPPCGVCAPRSSQLFDEMASHQAQLNLRQLCSAVAARPSPTTPAYRVLPLHLVRRHQISTKLPHLPHPGPTSGWLADRRRDPRAAQLYTRA